MISLHDVYVQGSDAVKAAVITFGTRHPANHGDPISEPDWKQAEKHFTYLIEDIMGTAVPPQASAAATVRRAENAAIDFLLAVNNRPNYRCPICVKRQRASR
ncbi:hypothetical protein ACFV5G_17595 [Streptomyces sp. NPDC059766]|uniref:hypothetical protein n=1 Tax=Streptomyces sp. NPDC059766 TaxID=3346940 RepID=UPI003667A2BF